MDEGNCSYKLIIEKYIYKDIAKKIVLKYTI